MLMMGCSHSQSQVLTLLEQKQMDDDLRIYGNPYENLNGQHYFEFYASY
jgi:hypothetical protein